MSSSTKGDVYVVDLTNSRVMKFSAAGEPASFEATGTNELDGSSTPKGSFSTPAYIATGPTGDIYVENAGEPVIDVFNPKGEYVPQAPGAFVAPSFEGGTYSPFGVGVDQANGDVYVSDRQTGGVIDVFEADGTFLRTFPTGAGGSDSVAVNSSGDVYVDNENASVTEFTATGTPLGTLDGVTPQAVAVDPSDQNVFVGENGSSASYQIAEYAAPATPGEAPKVVFGGGGFASNGSYGIAVNGPTHQVYASNAAGADGLIFEEGPTPEAPETGVATPIKGGTSEELNGVVNPHSNATVSYHFEYNTGASCAGGTKTEPQKIENEEAKAVSSTGTGLTPDTEYTFCLVAENDFGSTAGPPVPFKTSAGKPLIELEFASGEPTATTAKVSAKINPDGAEASCTVRYGPTAAYGKEIACTGALGNGGAGVETGVELTGLEPDTTYHYKFFATNEAGEGEGSDQTLKTLVAPPTIVQPPSVPVVGRVSVLLTGTINPENTLVFYHFVYGTTSQYGSSAPVTEGGSVLGAEQVSQILEGLTPGTTYHYALIVSNTGGSETSSDGTFRTGQSTPPLAVTGTANAIASTSATLAGTVNPDGLPTTYTIQIGTDTTYGGELSGVAGSGPEAVSASSTFANLQPGMTYHYRLTATNQDGTSYGQDETFMTTGFPTSLTAPVSPLLIATPQLQFPAAESTTIEPKLKTLTNAQKLANALKACKKKPKSKRAGCVQKARRKYAPAKTKGA